jgi:hypothetical protein
LGLTLTFCAKPNQQKVCYRTPANLCNRSVVLEKGWSTAFFIIDSVRDCDYALPMFTDFGISEEDWNAKPQYVRRALIALQHQARLIRFTAYDINIRESPSKRVYLLSCVYHYHTKNSDNI